MIDRSKKFQPESTTETIYGGRTSVGDVMSPQMWADLDQELKRRLKVDLRVKSYKTSTGREIITEIAKEVIEQMNCSMFKWKKYNAGSSYDQSKVTDTHSHFY